MKYINVSLLLADFPEYSPVDHLIHLALVASSYISIMDVYARWASYPLEGMRSTDSRQLATRMRGPTRTAVQRPQLGME